MLHDESAVNQILREVESTVEDERRRFGVVEQNKTDDPVYLCPAADPFPLDVFPEGYQKLAKELSTAFQVPIEIPSVALLACTTGLLGRSVCVEAKPGWREHPNLWIAIVGPSGIGKSPVVNELLRPIQAKESAWFDEYKAERREWERQKRKDDEVSDPPVRQQIIVDDWTLESVAAALSGNPRGLLLCRDELAGMLGDVGKYRKNGGDSDKKRLLSAYDCGPWSVNRKTAGDLFIKNACLSIFGTIQPEILSQAFGADDVASGFASRFLFCWSIPKRPALWSDSGLSQWARDKTVELSEVILSGFYLDATGEPFSIEVSDEARREFIAWHDVLATLPFLDVQASERMSVTSKLRGQTLRLALVLAVLEYIDSNEAIASHDPIRGDTMRRAVRLAKWFLPQSMRAWDAILRVRKCSGNPLVARIGRAIVELQDKAEKGAVPYTAIAARLNKGKPEKLHVTERAIGATLKKMGAPTTRRGGGWVVLLTEDLLDRLAEGLS